MGLYKLKRGTYFHQGRRVFANDKFGNNIVELRDNHPMLKETERWERVGDTGGASASTGASGGPQFLPASGPAQGSTAPAHNASEVLTSETVRGGAIPGVTEPLVSEGEQAGAGAGESAQGAQGKDESTDKGAPTASLGDASDPTANPERDAVANSSLSNPTRDWYTYTIPQAVHHVRAASDLTTLAQYKNLELAPKLGKQRSRVLEAIDERARELRKEE